MAHLRYHRFAKNSVPPPSRVIERRSVLYMSQHRASDSSEEEQPIIAGLLQRKAYLEGVSSSGAVHSQGGSIL